MHKYTEIALISGMPSMRRYEYTEIASISGIRRLVYGDALYMVASNIEFVCQHVVVFFFVSKFDA